MLLNATEIAAINEIVARESMRVFEVTKEVRNLTDTIDFVTITIDCAANERLWVWRNNDSGWVDYPR